MENTPLYDALRAFAAARPLRMHMPGHKGRPLPAPELAGLSALDFTELPPTGDLFSGGGRHRGGGGAVGKGIPHGPLPLSHRGGATQGVQAALALACGRGTRYCWIGEATAPPITPWPCWISAPYTWSGPGWRRRG